MAKSIFNVAIFFNLLLIFFLLLFITSTTQSRHLDGVHLDPKAKSAPSCETVFGVRSGDTCFGIAQLFGLTTESFGSINPNLNCGALFVGQWLCVVGSP
ncbi:hypothetical protein Pint_27295 [Pistacia integerrima]|uniref:Uncharacterized protein n=1 Tax=Pistacia integerrima TaxID=434235 RepID=A0ACC0YQQ7_9ROSI|nr:hypothetical protein Pint_27295 [Pistacia integerrima]